jgi:predicted membrane-bound spermidine synthase
MRVWLRRSSFGFGRAALQVVWQRMLGIFAGSDTVSAALVVGAFLTGLGIGSLAGAKAADRLPPARALLGFALCEAGVAVFALLSKPFLYDLLAVELAGVVDAPAAVFALCFAGHGAAHRPDGRVLALAGAGGGDLARHGGRADRLALRAEHARRRGRGAGGRLAAGRQRRLRGHPLAAAALDFGRRADRAQPAAVPPRPPGAGAAPAGGGAPPPRTPALRRAAAVVRPRVPVGLRDRGAGDRWVRVMGQVGQFHAYLFPTVLGVFLLADGAGIAVASRLVRRLDDPRPAFFLAQAGGFALAAALILALWLALPHWPLRNYLVVDQWRLGGRSFFATVALTVAVVGPPSFLIGMTFPLVQRAVQQDLATVGARVGWVQLANIAGNAAGSVGTGLVSLHFLGTSGTLRLLAALSLALLLGWLWRAGGPPRRRASEWALAAVCAAALVAVPSNAAFWDRMHGRGSGAFAARAEDRSGVAFFRGDGDADAAAAPMGRFFIAGHAQGSIPFQARHLLLGAAGPLLHPDPRRVLLVGVGSGGTPWGALVSPGVERLRAVEIVGPVLTALGEVARREPEGAVAALLADPRARLEYGDGRRAVAGAIDRYDVVEADAIRPETSHSGLLYSREFLEQVRGRLAPGGLYVQWVPTRRAIETFAAVFPHAVLLRPANIMVGSDAPIPAGAAERLLARLAEPAVAAHLGRGGPGAAAAVAVAARSGAHAGLAAGRPAPRPPR